MPRKSAADPVNFETTLLQLEKLVEEMESGQLSLEDSLKRFEDGIQMVRHCQNALKQAEQKIEILTKESAELEVTPFENLDLGDEK